MLNRAGELAAAAAEAEFRFDEKFFHDDYPPLNLVPGGTRVRRFKLAADGNFAKPALTLYWRNLKL